MPGQPTGSDQGPDEVPYPELLRALRRFLRTEGERYLDDPNVASVGIGHKVTDGRRTPELSVQFVVEEKLADPGDLAARGTTPVPDAITIAGIRVPTDVLERTG
jgi:endonuclease G